MLSGQNRAIDFSIVKLYNALSYSGGITMKRNLIAVLAFGLLNLFGTSAFALGLGNDNPGGNSTVLNTNTNTNNPTAISGSYSGAHADAYARAQAQQAQMQLQAQQQRQQQAQQVQQGQHTQQGNVQGVTVGGQTTTYTSPGEVRNIQDGTATLRTVPSVSAPAALPTAPCRISLSAGVAVIGFGGTFGGSVEDEKCTMRENARLLDSLGAREAALLVMCYDEHVAAVLGVCKQVK